MEGTSTASWQKSKNQRQEDGEMMDETIQMLCLGNEELPQEWAANTSFQMTKSEARYLLIIADSKDGMLDLFLFRKNGERAECVSQGKIPINLKQVLKGKLTGILIQQIQLRRKLGNGNERIILQDIASIFLRTSEMMQLFRDFEVTLTNPQGYTVRSIHQHVREIVEKCELDLTKYPQFFKKKPQENTMLHMFNGMFMEWNSLMCMVTAFLQQQDWKGETKAQLHVVMCGTPLQMAALAEPTIGGAKSIRYAAGSKQRLYNMTSEMLETRGLPKWNLTLQVNQYPYEKKLSEAFGIYNKRNMCTANGKINIFHDTLLIIPANSGVYGGSLQGKLHPFCSLLTHREDETLLTAPFSEAFSALISSGSVTLEETHWTMTEMGWQFETQFTYRNRRYHPAPKIFDAAHIHTLRHMPAIVMFRQSGNDSMKLYVVGRDCQVALFQGKRNENVVEADQGTKTYYFKIMEGSQYLGQVAYRRERGGSKNG